MRPAVKLAIKFSLVIGLFAVLIERNVISVSALRGALHRWPWMLAAFGVACVSQALGMWRWQGLLAAQGIPLRFRRVVELCFVGNFFNVALPGAVSGDVVKAILVASDVPGKRARAMSSIFFDRVVGVTCLVMVGATALAMLWGTPEASRLLGSIQAFLVISGIGVLAFYAYLFALSGSNDPVFRVLKWGESRFRAVGSLVRIYEGIHEYQRQRNMVGLAVFQSISIHVLMVVQYALLAQALGETQMDLLGLGVVVPLGLLVTAVPLLPGGVGTGHAAFLFFMRLLGSERGADLFNLGLMFVLIFAAVGGVVYLRFKKSEQNLLNPMHDRDARAPTLSTPSP
jgi:uncharacterized protein (TIRG00374 family)